MYVVLMAPRPWEKTTTGNRGDLTPPEPSPGPELTSSLPSGALLTPLVADVATGVGWRYEPSRAAPRTAGILGSGKDGRGNHYTRTR